MKKVMYLFLSLACVLHVQAQAVEIGFQQSIGGSQNDIAGQAVLLNDGAMVTIGSSYSNDGAIMGDHHGAATRADIIVTKVSADNTVVWTKSIGGTADDFGYSICNTSDDGFLIAGSSESVDGDVAVNLGNRDGLLCKLDASGNIEWLYTYGGLLSDELLCVQPIGEDFVVAGYSASFNHPEHILYPATDGGKDGWLMIIDKYGSRLQAETYGGGNDDVLTTVYALNDESFYAGGYSNSSNGNLTKNNGAFDAWSISLDIHFNLLWSKSYGGNSDDAFTSIISAPDGNQLYGGYTGSNDGDVFGNHGIGTADMWLVKLNPFGDFMEGYCFGSSEYDAAYDIDYLTDGNILLSGISKGNDGDIPMHFGSSDYCVIALSDAFGIQYVQVFGGTNQDILSGAVVSPNNTVLLTGTSYSSDMDVLEHYGTPDHSDIWYAVAGEIVKWYVDPDADGFGDESLVVEAVFQPEGFSANLGDCDNAIAEIHPDATEICNTIDDNCDGLTDDVELALAIYGADAAACAGDTMVLIATAEMDDYTWYRNGTLIPGATGVTLPVTKSGSYTVETTKGYCLATTTTDAVTFYKKPKPVISANTTDLCGLGYVKIKANTAAGMLYQWNLNGNPIEGATNYIYIAKVVGSYTVTEKNVSGCTEVSLPIEIHATCRLAEESNSLQLYPNPARDQIRISYAMEEQVEEQAHIQMYDQFGTLVYSMMQESSNECIVSIDPGWANGIYLIRITSGNMTLSERVVIQK